MSKFFLSIERFVYRLLNFIFNPPPKEAQTMPSYLQYSATEIRKRINDRAYQLEIIAWVDSYLRPLDNDALVLEMARKRPFGIGNFTTAKFKAVIDRMSSLMEGGTPAHEDGHRWFDALDVSAIISDDPYIARAYRNEIDAAFWAGWYHDNSTDVQHRYIDAEWECNHCELGAWRFYHATEGLIAEPIRRLAAYYIAQHQQMTSEKKAKVGTQKPWNDRLFFWDGHPVRIGVWICRWADRLENGGDSATHLVRHALAAVDGARIGGMDLHHLDGFYNFRDQLAYLFTPATMVAEFPRIENGITVMKDGQPVMDKFPSMLKHLEGYRISAGPAQSIYNQHDGKSPNMRFLMDWKVSNSKRLIQIITETTGEPNFEFFEKQMKMKSGYPNSNLTLEAIELVRNLWNLTSPDDQSHWAQGFEFALKSYYEWLEILQAQISKATDPTVKAFRPLVKSFVARVTKV